MGLLDKLVAALKGKPATPAAAPAPAPAPDDQIAIVRQIADEAMAAAPPNTWQYPLSGSARWRALQDESPDLQAAIAQAALESVPTRSGTHQMRSYWTRALCKTMASQLLRRKLPFTERQLQRILTLWADLKYPEELPGKSILSAVEHFAAGRPLPPTLSQPLTRLHKRCTGLNPYGWQQNKQVREVGERVARILNPAKDTLPDLPRGSFGDRVTAFLNDSGDTRPTWTALFLLAAEAGDKSKPSAKWLAEMAKALDAVDRDAATANLGQWLSTTTPDPAQPDRSLDILKGLIWGSVHLDHGAMAGPLGRFAETCFRKVPNIGARSVKLGNAVMWALSDMAGEPRAAAELVRLRDRIKYPSARALIDNRLAELASKSGQTVQSLEDLSLPDFGLDGDSRATVTFGEARAELALSALDLDVQWFNAAGKPVKSIPAEVRRDHDAALAVLRTRIKDIEAARASQIARFEQSWMEGRDWALGDWKQHVQGHAVRRPIAETLIWRLDTGAAVMVRDGALAGRDGTPVTPSDATRIRLWHPLDSPPDEVLLWRQAIIDRGLTQPVKQAHREIYVLTDAERQTRIYSNRFAAHILRQHQFRALCQARGWSYGLMGGWDGWNLPERSLPAQGLRVQYQVDVVDDGQRSDSYVALHVATDQVRFVNGRDEPVELEAIPPIVFSEALRDVDLFVAITSIANDPNWTDGGPEGRYGGYWREWAFGALGQSAETRKALIATIAPRLSIRDSLEVGEKSLIVQGKRQKYAIHFGSGNIQILPANRYLCIVPDRAPPETTGLKLPFAGDGLLSIILSKAFMLVDEDRIKDPTILRQL